MEVFIDINGKSFPINKNKFLNIQKWVKMQIQRLRLLMKQITGHGFIGAK